MSNPYLLAADSPDACIALLRENPSLASGQDEHGYSLIHAAASYNHLDLLRTLVSEFKVPVNLKDEDGETALFVVETVAAAKVLVEELKLDTTIVNDEGQTAREKIEAEEDYPEVAEYLRGLEGEASNISIAVNGTTNGTTPADLPPAPEGLQVQIGTMNEAEDAGEPDPEFRRRIEELASREDFETVEGQAALRQLVEDAILGPRQE
ncbi:hypothetical protein SMACR_07338 [Sordaria macrospora]|uniref:WGS project CABT00000000 data, contig 2.45 n=2 Tax=Sordaria macrospora TaxID=5147 RepID=F7W8I4_SORMK|nr:uncharacterized protein SMAC_07338 [Sordaria macrospora k-hell]KAA8628503.1 hypothetical protein SMACR_07338 [Sordaria macrospora]KAH7631229.1 hypothetical protein B0T09DRAFT_132045 [Sordaria sp. MPI-SDFR-AT-0083]WPJ61680.1 hypothetical protein SMAC4_07338 [Sordaria macrospora]CCC05015.1 unnamed protein product [Sordaria macrospora k-hell]